MKSTNDEVGIIGQVYEDRRNGKSGRLVSRDTKYKTLAFEPVEGKPFLQATCTYSTFRSNLRKVNTDGPVETKEEAYAEVELTEQELTADEAEKIEKKAERKAKRARKAAEAAEKEAKAISQRKLDGYNSLLLAVMKYVESFGNLGVQVAENPYKCACGVKINGRLMLMMYSRAKKQEVYCVTLPQLASSVQHNVELFKCKHHNAKTTGHFTESHSIHFTDLNEYLEEYREAFIEVLSFVKESEEN